VTNPRGTAKKGTPFITQLEIKPELIANRAGLVRTRLDVASGNNGRAIPVDADVVVIPSSVTLAAKVNSAAPGSDCRYELALNLQERGGIDTTLTSLRINGDDYTGQIANWFGTAQLNANAAAGANLKICGPVNVNAPYELVIGGRDAGSGRSWSIHQLTEIPR
jgi:hypothetical protein